MYRFSDGGARFTTEDPNVAPPFELDGSVLLYEEPPSEDQAPDYPPPRGSPAAG
jgi:hypothetical protein